MIASFIAIAGYVIYSVALPYCLVNPVVGADDTSYNHETFWYPWGDHPHRGIDIFAEEGTKIEVNFPHGIVIATNMFKKGGNSALILAFDGRVHYYAHMQNVYVHVGQIVNTTTLIGTVGKTGNANRPDCPPHLHYSIVSLTGQGDKGIWYVNPIAEFNTANEFNNRHCRNI